jgi:hypothetical protein
MLAAGGGYTRDNTSTEGDLSMLILCDFGSSWPLWRVQTWALERLISFHLSGDLRWALLALALRSFTAAWAFGQGQFVLLVRSIASRAGKEACFGANVTDADTMVAAGGR